ncbi:MAG: site-2 protease family protein [Planctomycetota bacterium]
MEWWVQTRIAEGRVPELISQLFWVIFSITLHELAHGWTALRQGDPTPRTMGRMTMNPLVHMGGWSFLMLALCGIAWGLMPTDPSRYRSGRRGRSIVAIAGPVMNIGLAVVSLFLLAMWLRFGVTDSDGGRIVTTFLLIGGYINLFLAAFNMLPIPPLDGSNVLSGLSFTAYRFFQKPEVQMYGMFVVIMLFFMTPVGDLMSSGAALAAGAILGLFGGSL